MANDIPREVIFGAPRALPSAVWALFRKLRIILLVGRGRWSRMRFMLDCFEYTSDERVPFAPRGTWLVDLFQRRNERRIGAKRQPVPVLDVRANWERSLKVLNLHKAAERRR